MFKRKTFLKMENFGARVEELKKNLTGVDEFNNGIQRLKIDFFDKSLKKFYSTISSISRMPPFNGYDLHPAHVKSSKFLEVYSALANKNRHLDMIQIVNNFIDKYLADLLPSIVQGESGSTRLRSDWLKYKDIQRPKKSREIQIIGDSGISIRVSETDPKLIRTGIPLAEIYHAISKIYDQDPNTDLPFRFWQDLYYFIYHTYIIRPDMDPKIAESFLSNASDFNYLITNTEASNSNLTSGGIFDQVKGFAEKFLGKGKIDNITETLKNTLDGVLSEKSTSKVTEAFKELQEKVTSSGSITEGLQQTLKSEKFKEVFQGAQKALGGLIPGINQGQESESDSDSEDSTAPGEME